MRAFAMVPVLLVLGGGLCTTQARAQEEERPSDAPLALREPFSGPAPEVSSGLVLKEFGAGTGLAYAAAGVMALLATVCGVAAYSNADLVGLWVAVSVLAPILIPLPGALLMTKIDSREAQPSLAATYGIGLLAAVGFAALAYGFFLLEQPIPIVVVMAVAPLAIAGIQVGVLQATRSVRVSVNPVVLRDGAGLGLTVAGW